jgi:NADPH-dependent 2,4-dienoyl-CoA reductase/sulfur reductase-like enzyme
MTSASSDATIEIDVLIVGAGPAGLAAARALVDAGIRVLICDDNEQGGGQYFRQLPFSFSVSTNSSLHRDQPRALQALFVLTHPLVTYWNSTTFWSVTEDGEFAYSRHGTTGRVKPRNVILATGAYDKPSPFPGWTLPGVISAGGCLNLIKGQGIVPGRRVALAGNGPLLLVAAYSLLRAGVRIVAIAEAARTMSMLRQAAGLLASPALLRLGIKYRGAIMAAGVKLLTGHAVTKATGSGRVQQVLISPIGTDGRPGSKGGFTVEVDSLVTGYGLSPATEFAQMMGLDMHFDRILGGWVPRRSTELELSRAGIFGAGDGCGIGGVELATLEGRRAGLSVARRNGLPVDALVNEVDAKLGRMNKFRRALSAAYLLPNDVQLATPDTLVCRCENVTLAKVQAAARESCRDLSHLKFATRISMGSCQGRNCLSTCAGILSHECALPIESLVPPRMRPPVRPIPMTSLITETLSAAREPSIEDGVL